MPLVSPILAVFDSATIGKVSGDYWSPEKGRRDKARSFIARLRERGVHVAIALNHVSELLRYDDDAVARDRLRFLCALPMIAWVRPYDRNWFPGGFLDLVTRELDAVVRGNSRNWRAIVDQVRPDLWETGTGSEMFGQNNERLWSFIRSEAKRQHKTEMHVASVARTDPGELFSLKLREVLSFPKRPKGERPAYMSLFVEQIQRQLAKHGDPRLQTSRDAAIGLAVNTLKQIEAAEADAGDAIRLILEPAGIPVELIDPEMTIGEIGELAVYAEQLKIFSRNLNPSRTLNMRDVPPDTSPSYALERRLAAIQRKAERVSGSDIGDRQLAPLAFYSDFVEVDKRTFEYMRQIRRVDPNLDELFGRFLPSSDYVQIAERFEAR
jgi:hypothetical protein